MVSRKEVVSRLPGEKDGQQANRWGIVFQKQFLASLKGYNRRKCTNFTTERGGLTQ